MAQRGFLLNLFGNGHPYSPAGSPDLYDHISLADVKSHYTNFYRSDNFSITASGFIDDEVVKLITENFSSSWGKATPKEEFNNHKLPVADKVLFIEKEGANQNALAMGKLFPTQNHPDFPAIKLLCTIFGGYFGSRLMSNIREEKGYTYSIQASPISFLHNGVFLVFAEVKTEKTEETIKEIFVEMEKLNAELITEKELIPIQNYLLGRILEDFDGPFARAHTFSSLREANLDFKYYDQLIDAIKSTTPYQLREIAQKYLNPLTMSTIVAGTK